MQLVSSNGINLFGVDVLVMGAEGKALQCGKECQDMRTTSLRASAVGRYGAFHDIFGRSNQILVLLLIPTNDSAQFCARCPLESRIFRVDAAEFQLCHVTAYIRMLVFSREA